MEQLAKEQEKMTKKNVMEKGSFAKCSTEFADLKQLIEKHFAHVEDFFANKCESVKKCMELEKEAERSEEEQTEVLMENAELEEQTETMEATLRHKEKELELLQQTFSKAKEQWNELEAKREVIEVEIKKTHYETLEKRLEMEKNRNQKLVENAR